MNCEEFPMRWWTRARAPMKNLCGQVRSNAIALISLLLALTSVTYGTWRDERTERNRNIRSATSRLPSITTAPALVTGNADTDETPPTIPPNLSRLTLSGVT